MNDFYDLHYRLIIEPDLTTYTFKGHAELSFRPARPLEQLTLHCLGLAVENCEVQWDDRQAPAAIRIDEAEEQLVIDLPETFERPLTVCTDYRGVISDGMAGFYRSSYRVDGQAQPLAVTQFQESDARRALPCLDHPRHKATFDVTLVVEAGHTAISNGRVQTVTPRADGRLEFVFERTPRMSTYLLFFGVGNFESVQDDEDPRVRLMAGPGATPYGKLGLAFGRQSLQFCERYFGIPYPLGKMDLLAIPDFAFGAMENWGAITFRENLLLDDPATTSKEGRERICEVIAHEVTHQWFGNLVTPADWCYLWLNESFATYFGYGIVDHYYPDWGIWEKFVLGQTDGALQRDALLETFPIEIPGGEHMVINTATAPIIYSKGGSILRQIRDYIGEDNFRNGLQHYLQTHAYDCAGSQDFWAAFEAVSEAPVSAIMRAWVEQPGYPVLTAERAGDTLRLAQQRFTFEPQEEETLWPIPVTLRLFAPDGTQRQERILLEAAEQRIPIGDAVAVKVNDGQTGFYRVAYADAAQRAALGVLVRGRHLAPIDRWGLQNDLFAMVRAGREQLSVYLNFLSWYADEADYMPLVSIDRHLRQAHLLTGAKETSRITAAGRKMTARILAQIGFEPAADESHAIATLRDQFLFSAVVFGDTEATAFARATAERSDVHPDILKAVHQADAFLNGGAAFERLVARFQRASSEHERQVVLTAMGCFREPDVLAQARSFVLAEVPDRNRFIPLVAMGSNPDAVVDLWEWFAGAQDQLADFHPLLLERVIAAVIPVAGMRDPDAVEAFCSRYLEDHPQAADVVKLSLEKLAINLRFAAAAEGAA